MHKISYTIVKKNRRPNAPWYLRRRETGQKDLDVNLGTSDRRVAETELMRVKLAESEGSSSPLDSLAIRRKGLCEPVSVPGGVLERWETEMRVEGLREATVAKYTRAARLLVGDRGADGLTPDFVRNVMAGTVNLKSNTRRSYANALGSLFRHMGRHDLAAALPKVVSESGDRPWWTRQDMADIIAEVRSNTAERTIEYKDFFGIMATVGSRQGETAALRWDDLRDGVLTFRASTTKGKKERSVPIPTWLEAQIEARRPERYEGMPMFPYVGRANQATRFKVLSRALKELGLKGGLQTFRRSVSMILFKECKDIKAVAQLLGHSPAVALQYYQNSRGVEELRKIVETM